ncbi:hypothetical protein JR316_0008531 [Psilocybe cubensis]|uniref:Uncharacterized protein n=2 Tax=Psilocybe cubensis TaxID=181762 RepID=A0ACB8GWH1_PSICU|nr:hypothetical protein JR316_0008531 [Psilocybe cubensis]KAH9479934.1 hypothetical protein JR316_0008531 [Psilocybe cubensis]
MSVVDVDDADTVIIYKGSWQVLKGTAQEPAFQGTLHSTVDNRASASMIFEGMLAIRAFKRIPVLKKHIGTRLTILCVLPSSTSDASSIHTIININGNSSTVSHSTNATYIFNFVLYDTGKIPENIYTVTLSNAGNAADSPLQLDRFIVEGKLLRIDPLTTGSTSPRFPFTPLQTKEIPPKATPISRTVETSKTAEAVRNLLSAKTTFVQPTASSSPPAGILAFNSSNMDSSTGMMTFSPSNSVKFYSRTLSTDFHITTTEGNVVTEVTLPSSTSSSSSSIEIPVVPIIGTAAGIVFVIILVIFIYLRLRIYLSHTELRDDANDSGSLSSVSNISTLSLPNLAQYPQANSCGKLEPHNTSPNELSALQNDPGRTLDKVPLTGEGHGGYGH